MNEELYNRLVKLINENQLDAESLSEVVTALNNSVNGKYNKMQVIIGALLLARAFDPENFNLFVNMLDIYDGPYFNKQCNFRKFMI